MQTKFQTNDPSLESQWRALILFGNNSATYKFAFAKALLEVVNKQKTNASLEELAIPYANSIVEHLRKNDRQGIATTSSFLKACRGFIEGRINQTTLQEATIKNGFRHVIDAFQNVNGGVIPNKFYEKSTGTSKGIIATDSLLHLKESIQFENLDYEVESRWNLVETAWNLNVKPSLLEVCYDNNSSELYTIENDMKRIDITSVRGALNGYQKGKCFYSFQDISIESGLSNQCEVDHFLPHKNKMAHLNSGANINGVWNLVLANAEINAEKSAKVPEIEFLERLFNRNEFYIQSKHPLAETIINQTGNSAQSRRKFLQAQYNIALNASIQNWRPSIELPGTF